MYIHAAWIWYTNCIHNVYGVHFLLIRIDVYKLYTKCLYTKCIPHFDKLLSTFCIQNLAGIVLLTLYTKCLQKFVEMWHTFCIHQLYTSCTVLVYKMYTQFSCGRSSKYVFLKMSQISQEKMCWSLNFSKVAGLTFLKTNSNRCFPVKFAEFLKTAFFFTEHFQWLLPHLSGRPMLCKLNWYMLWLWHRYFPVNFDKFFKTLLTTWGGCYFLSQNAKHQNRLSEQHTMGWLFAGKYSQCGNRFLTIREDYI